MMVANIMWSTPKLSGKDLGAFNIQDAIQNGLKTYMGTLEAGARPTQLRQDSLHKELSNQILGDQAKYSKEQILADLLRKKLSNQILGVNVQYAQPSAEAGLQGAHLGNEISRTNLQYLPEKLKAEIGQHIAAQQASLARTENERNGGRLSHLTGVAADIASIQALEQQLGADSPLVKQARQAFQLKQESQQGLNEYRRSLADSTGKRGSSSYGKLVQEEDDVKAGFLPGTNRTIPISEQQQLDMLGQYRNQRLKLSSDKSFRDKVGYAKNIDKSLNMIDPQALLQYSGISGALQKKSQEVRAPFGLESQEYRKYQKALSGAEVLAKQVRQFYGDSIQPSVNEALKHITNPESWKSNPRLAKEKYNFVKNILLNETSTYKNALTDTKELLGDGNDTASNDPLGLR